MRQLLLLLTSLILCCTVHAQWVTWTSMDGPFGGHMLLVGAEDGTAFRGLKSSIERSDDGGLTWVDTAFPGSNLRALDLGHDGALLAAAASGAFRLFEGEWTPIGLPGASARRAGADMQGNTYVWHGSCTFARSGDLVTWEELTPWNDWPCMDMLVAPDGEVLVIRSMYEIALSYWVEHSLDGGQTWTNRSPGQLVQRLVSGQHGGTFAIAPPGDDGYSGYRPPRTYRWTGSEWVVVATEHVTGVTTLPGGEVVFGYRHGFDDQALAGALSQPVDIVRTNGDAWLASTAQAGLWRWTATDSWHQIAGGPANISVLTRDREDRLIAGFPGSTVQFEGSQWRHGDWTRSLVSGIATLPGRTLLASPGYIGDGIEWYVEVGAGIWDVEADELVEVGPSCDGFAPCIGNGLLDVDDTVIASIGGYPLVCSPGDARCAGRNESGLFRSTDGGAEWQHVLGVPNLCHLAVSPDGTLWAGPGNPSETALGSCVTWDAGGKRVHFSDDGGETWLPVQNQVPGGFVTALAAGEEYTFIATGPNAVYRLVDDLWEPIGGPGSPIHSLDVSIDNALLVGTETGLHAFNGTSWFHLGFADLTVNVVRVEQDGIVYLATSDGVFRSDEPLVVSGSIEPSVSQSPVQIYPNPTTGGVTISFFLNEPDDLQVAVYDVLGRRVTVLAEGPFDIGRHEMKVPLSGYAAGTYFVELRQGDERSATQLTVLGQ